MAALSTEFLGEFGALGEGAVRVAVCVVITGRLVRISSTTTGIEMWLFSRFRRHETHGRLWLRSPSAHPWASWRS